MRLRCVKDLRTFCQKLYAFSLNIPSCVMQFIYGYSNMTLSGKTNEIIEAFNKAKNVSENIKTELKIKLGPYLANPFFSKELTAIETADTERSNNFLKMINETQFNLIQSEEENSKNFTTRLLNNFTALMTLFDNFIFEEEFISLGDEEYFAKRENYNELLKLREAIDEKNNPQGDGGKKAPQGKGGGDLSKYDLDSKRTFKKNYKGIKK